MLSSRRVAFATAILSAVLMGQGSADKDKKSGNILDRIAGWVTADVEAAVAKFLGAVSSGNQDASYAVTSRAFKHWLSADQLRAFAQARSWPAPGGIKWGGRSVNYSTAAGSRTELDGSFAGKNGAAERIRLVLVKEGTEWRIQGIDFPDAAADGAVPSEEALAHLVNDTMNAFGQSVKANSMAHLHSQIAVAFRDQASVQQLDEKFGPFLNKGFTLPNYATLSPFFSETPAIESGTLSVKGHYLQGPKQAYTFRLSYVFEGIAWKLIGLSVNADNSQKGVDALRPAVPSRETYLSLARSAMADFAASAAASDMTRFRERMSVAAKGELSAEHLNKVFEAFFKERSELPEVARLAPVIDPAPTISPDGKLVIIGHYATTPRPVAFRLIYVREGLGKVADGWKLSGIRVLIDADAVSQIKG